MSDESKLAFLGTYSQCVDYGLFKLSDHDEVTSQMSVDMDSLSTEPNFLVYIPYV